MELTATSNNDEIKFRFDLLLLSKVNDRQGKAKFDIYLNGVLHHDSNMDGIPGPSAVENLVELMRQQLPKS